jgi:hypothetical protein
MTEKLNKNDLREDFWIDRFADKVSKSKIARAILGLTAVGTASQMAACVTPPPAEVAPVNEAVLSGVISQDSVDKLSGNSKIIVENNLTYIANKYVEDENFVPGTEMIYIIGNDANSVAYLFGGFKNTDGSVGLRVTDYCQDWIRDNGNCQNVEKDLLMVEGEGNRLYGFIDENNEQHPILLIDKDNNPTAFDINGSSYVERVVNSDGFLEKIVSIGAMSVEAAAPEATATATATSEPTATETPQVTPTENPYKNIGKFPLTLEREDIEENGLIIPFNPVDNPEEFIEYVRSIERKSGGYLGWIKGLDGGGFDPVNNKTEVHGEILRYIQVMFFEYKDKYFPVVKTISSNGTLDDFTLLSDIWQYDQLGKNIVEGAKVKFIIFREMEKHDPEGYSMIASRELLDLAKEAKMSLGYFKELE